MQRVLFLKLGPYFLPDDLSNQEKYKLLSGDFSGDIVVVVHKKEFKDGKIGNFTVRGLYLNRIRHINSLRDIAYFLFSFSCVYSHYFKKKYDIIVAYDPILTGLLGLLISRLTGAKLVVEVNGNYEKAFRLNSGSQSSVQHLKTLYCRAVIPFVLRRAHGIKLVNKNQLSFYNISSKDENIFVFPNFVPISHFKTGAGATKYILFMGFPWHLKGVDVLIKAFNKISADFPDYTLKIVGFCHDKTEYVRLADGNTRVELCDPVFYEDAIKLMSECSMFVLPSRTDSSPRVLREAMASKKPIIASNVDGIPFLIENGVNGLLFESENVDDLAEKMRIILSDKDYAQRLAANGYSYVYSTLSEKHYLNNFSNMISKIFNERRTWKKERETTSG